MATQRKFKKGEQVPAKIRSWTVGKNPKNGNLCVKINLEGYIQWTGWLTTAATPYTMKTLEACGFRGANLGQLRHDNALDTSKEFFAIIGESRVHDGKTYYEADFINDPDKQVSGWSDKNVEKDLVDELERFDTRAYIDGASDIEPPAATQDYSVNTDANFASDDIPF